MTEDSLPSPYYYGYRPRTHKRPAAGHGSLNRSDYNNSHLPEERLFTSFDDKEQKDENRSSSAKHKLLSLDALIPFNNNNSKYEGMSANNLLPFSSDFQEIGSEVRPEILVNKPGQEYKRAAVNHNTSPGQDRKEKGNSRSPLVLIT